MSYIKSFAFYLPRHTVADAVFVSGGRKNTHSVSYVDEDILTMAFESCKNLNTDGVDAVIFATTTPVFKDRYHASYLADLLNLPEGITAFDLGTTNRSGTDALYIADSMIQSGRYNNILLLAADINFLEIGQETSQPFGHGAVAIVISKDKGIAEITRTSTYSSSFAEKFQYKGETVEYDARFARNVGFIHNMNLVLSDLNPLEIDGLMINAVYAKAIMKSLKKASFDLDKQLLPDILISKCGYLGSAHGLLRLIHSVENIHGTAVLIDYNNGSNVICVKTNAQGKRSKLFTDFLNNKTVIQSYNEYLILRKQGKFDDPAYKTNQMFSSEMMYEREKDQLLRLKGFECTQCNTTYLIKAARCNKCKGEEFTSKQLSTFGTVYTLTSEYYYPSSFPPTNMVVIDLEGGGRITVQQTDDLRQDDSNRLNIGDKVQLVLRKMIETDSKPNYFWKCRKL